MFLSLLSSSREVGTILVTLFLFSMVSDTVQVFPTGKSFLFVKSW